MSQAVIPFVNIQQSGWEELGGASPVAHNILIDGKASIRRRPGLSAFPGATTNTVDSSGLIGLFQVSNGDLYAVGNTPPARRIYRVTSSSVFDVSGIPGGTELRGTGRPVFAETESVLAMAGGEEPQKVVLATHDSSHIGGNPPRCTHVIANAERLLVNNVLEPNRVYYSDLAAGSSYAGYEVWNGTGTSGFFGVDARPDKTIALAENTNEVLALGQGTMQVFATDPTLVYSSVTTVELGTSAPYSLIKKDQEYCFLDRFRRFVKSSGRGFAVISDPIQKTLQSIADVSDCFGYRVVIGAYDCLVWTFPTDGRTFVFQDGAGWSQWSSTDGNLFARFKVNCHCLAAGDFTNIVGTTDGKIFKLDMASTTDDGTAIEAYVLTGYINHDTEHRKHCASVRLTLSRGAERADGADTPQGWLMWRDQPGPWKARIPVTLGATGDVYPVVEFYSLGVYQRRQWGFEFSGSEDMVLVSAIENFEVMEN